MQRILTVTLLSPLVSGTVGVGMRDELPVADVDLDVIWLGESVSCHAQSH